jgi:catechol 2,3-dioxygenase-like lactoylglutathione lyase family enzyme
LTSIDAWATITLRRIHRQFSIREVIVMARVQLALNVSDVDAAVGFYSKLFGVEPAKRRPGYANFAVDVPPLKLVLIENPDARGAGVAGALNHLGVEVETSDEVGAAAARLAGAGLATAVEENTACCYAVQDKVWVDDPDGAPWEVYTVLADVADAAAPVTRAVTPDSGSVPGSACACGPGVDCGPAEVSIEPLAGVSGII